MLEVYVFCIVTLLTLFILSVFYWHVIRPALLTQIRYSIFQHRDTLRSLAVHGKCDPSSFSFQHLEKMLNGMGTVTFMYSFGSLLESMISKRSDWDQQIKRDMEKFQSEATEEMRIIEQTSFELILRAMYINSPWWAILGAFLTLLRSLKRRLECWNKAAWYRTEFHGLNSFRPQGA